MTLLEKFLRVHDIYEEFCITFELPGDDFLLYLEFNRLSQFTYPFSEISIDVGMSDDDYEEYWLHHENNFLLWKMLMN